MGAMQDLMGAHASGTRTGRLISRSATHLSLTGARDLIRNFERLPVRLQRKTVRSAVQKVARRMVRSVKDTMKTEPTLHDHRAGVPFDTGLLYKSIGHRMWTAKTGQWAVGATIGPRKGFATMVKRGDGKKSKSLTKAAIAKVVAGGGGFQRSEYADPVKYAHLVERGVRAHGKHPGVEGRPFMLHGYMRSRDYLMGVLRTEIHRGLEREARKLARAASYGH